MLGSINLYVQVHFMDSGKTRWVFGVKVGGRAGGGIKGNFLCAGCFLGLLLLKTQGDVFSDETSHSSLALYISP